jgi:hypothetical protein
MPRSRTKARITAKLACTARLLRRTPEGIATPCSVNALGNFRVPPQLDVPNWDFKLLNSDLVSCIMKSSGNRSRFLLTVLFKSLVATPYKEARTRSRMTL